MIYDFHDDSRVTEVVLSLLIGGAVPNAWAQFSGTMDDIRIVIECVFGRHMAEGVRFTVH
jgi:hypothetical protein